MYHLHSHINVDVSLLFQRVYDREDFQGINRKQFVLDLCVILWLVWTCKWHNMQCKVIFKLPSNWFLESLLNHVVFALPRCCIDRFSSRLRCKCMFEWMGHWPLSLSHQGIRAQRRLRWRSRVCSMSSTDSLPSDHQWSAKNPIKNMKSRPKT